MSRDISPVENWPEIFCWGVEQACQGRNGASLGQRVKHDLAAITRRAVVVQLGAGQQPGRCIGSSDAARSVVLEDHVAHAFGITHQRQSDSTSQVVHGRTQYAVGEVVQLQSALGRTEAQVHTLLGRDSERAVLLDGVLNRSRLAGTNGVVVRQADTQGVTDLGAGPCELVVVLTIYVLQEGIGVDEEAKSLASDHVDRQKGVGHLALPLGKL